MKYNLILPVFLFILTSCIGTPKHDPEVLEFIEKQNDYVKLTDSEKLPENVKKYHTSITDYLNHTKRETEDYFVWLSYIEENDSTIKIPICHYDGFVKKFENRTKCEHVPSDTANTTISGEYHLTSGILGNASGGKDGNLIVDKQTANVVEFGLWR